MVDVAVHPVFGDSLGFVLRYFHPQPLEHDVVVQLGGRQQVVLDDGVLQYGRAIPVRVF